MKISLVQTDIIWADKTANLNRTEEKLRNLSRKTDLVVLPELFTTGFCVDRLDLAETMGENTVQQLKKWAHQFDLAIVGSFMATENGHTFNRSFFVFPSGEIVTADKRHLFSYGKENKHFANSDKRLIVHYKGFNILVLICYDVRFPVWSRNRNNEYDLLIYVANFPASRIKAWDVLLQARAIENQSYVCGVNIIGKDEKNTIYNGHSAMFDYLGNKQLYLEEENSTRTTQLSKNKLDDFRIQYPFWRDSDDFILLNA
jgi:predicted amidohydrolase